MTVASFYPMDKASGWDGLIRTYTTDHPNVKIEAQVTPGGNYVPKILAQVASNTAPDVLGAENSTIFFQLVKNKILEVLDDRLKTTKDFGRDDFFPALMNRYTVKGSAYGIPYDNQPVCMLFYRDGAFSEAGIAPPAGTWTYNDLLSAAKALTQRTEDRVTRYGVNVRWDSTLYAFGGRLVDDVENPTRCVLDSPEALEAMQFYVDLMYKYRVMPSPAEMQASGASTTDLFSTGRLAMDLEGYWVFVFTPTQYQNIGAKLQLGPKGPHGTIGYVTGGTAYCLSASSKQKDAGWSFITYFMGEIGHKEEYKAAKLPGASYPPAHVPSFEWYAKQPNFFGSIVAEATREADKFVIFAPASLNWPEVNTKVIAPAIDLIIHQKQPVTYLKEVARQATEMLQKLEKRS